MLKDFLRYKTTHYITNFNSKLLSAEYLRLDASGWPIVPLFGPSEPASFCRCFVMMTSTKKTPPPTSLRAPPLVYLSLRRQLWRRYCAYPRNDCRADSCRHCARRISYFCQRPETLVSFLSVKSHCPMSFCCPNVLSALKLSCCQQSWRPVTDRRAVFLPDT